MGWTVAFSFIFGVGAAVPVVWAIVGLLNGNKKFWPVLVGLAFAGALMAITLVEIATDWGGCDSSSASAAGAVTCIDRDGTSSSDEDACKKKSFPCCTPDVWAVTCKSKPNGWAPTCGRQTGACPNTSLCPHGFTPVYTFCEPIDRKSGVKQPAATWSDLSFIAAGLWLLWFLSRAGTFTSGSGATTVTMTSDDAENPMLEIGVLSVAYGLIVIFMGPPSMWYHASMRDWGGWFDSMSVVIWLGFNACYVIYLRVAGMFGKWRGAGRTIFVLVSFGVLLVILAIIATVCTDQHTILYFLTGGPWLVFEILYLCRGGFGAKPREGVVYRRNPARFWLNFGTFAVTMTVWVFFNDSIVPGSWCQAGEAFPGHALFHILASVGTVTTFISFASERRV